MGLDFAAARRALRVNVQLRNAIETVFDAAVIGGGMIWQVFMFNGFRWKIRVEKIDDERLRIEIRRKEI